MSRPATFVPRVLEFMRPGRWYRTGEISTGIGFPGSSIYAQMRRALDERIVLRRFCVDEHGRKLAEWALGPAYQGDEAPPDDITPDEEWPTQRIVPAHQAPMLQKPGPSSVFDLAYTRS